ncbi:uncharacterized protein LOC113561781 [Ooceraea biroi]|uniref:uncharacterized protein LOC113561781 n=1 Tax=Ooceraea biroi TaxID=2015173 RepID=UPI000F0937E6|nr:uncharacterized protein LOC113561781 [Ooceraea biroi]
MSLDAEGLVSSQNEIHRRISRSMENLRKMGVANITASAIDAKVAILDQLWAKFENQHERIRAELKSNFDRSEYVQSNLLEIVELAYVQQRSKLLEYARRFCDEPPKLAQPKEQGEEHASKTALPRIKLPPFSGKYKDWLSFRDLFQSVIGKNPAITNIERFHYLKSCLQGPAKRLIRPLSVTGENYDRAWALLSEHFENKKELIRANFSTSVARMKSESAEELSRIYHAVLATVNAQESIGRPIRSHGMDLFNHLVVELFDSRTRLEWESSICDSVEPARFDALTSFINKRILTLNAAKPKTGSKVNVESSRSAKAHFTKPGFDAQCALCKGKHMLMTCSDFKAKTANDRIAFVEDHRLCLNCLGNHALAKCQSKKTCLSCKAKHHTLIHDAFVLTAPEPVSALSAMHRYDDRKAILLATARVDVADRDGNPHFVRVLIDQGSEVSIVSEYLVQRLHLPRSRSAVSIFGIGGSRLGQTRADPFFSNSDLIELLLGTEVCSVILEEGIRKGEPSAPIAQKTTLGWILSGGCDAAASHCSYRSLQCSVDHELSELVQRFWKQEEEGAAPVALTPDEEMCENLFVSTHTRTADGRFVVRLPFAPRPKSLAETRKPAARLLSSMEQKCRQHPAFGDLYRFFMKEYEDLKHMEKVEPQSRSQDNPETCYLPHHGVMKESSSTTKLRVVFNGSQRTESGESLNDFLLVGANLIPALADVLSR